MNHHLHYDTLLLPAQRSYSDTSHPSGWDKHSYGYHGDDGHSFCSSGTGQPYGPTFTTGDVIGCCVNLINNTCFYTKNGHSLGKDLRYQSRYNNAFILLFQLVCCKIIVSSFLWEITFCGSMMAQSIFVLPQWKPFWTQCSSMDNFSQTSHKAVTSAFCGQSRQSLISEQRAAQHDSQTLITTHVRFMWRSLSMNSKHFLSCTAACWTNNQNKHSQVKVGCWRQPTCKHHFGLLRCCGGGCTPQPVLCCLIISEYLSAYIISFGGGHFLSLITADLIIMSALYQLWRSYTGWGNLTMPSLVNKSSAACLVVSHSSVSATVSLS